MHLQGFKCNVIDYCPKHHILLSCLVRRVSFASRIPCWLLYLSLLFIVCFKASISRLRLHTLQVLKLGRFGVLNIIFLIQMHTARLEEEYFKDPPSQLPQDFSNSLRSLVASYDPRSFWSFIRDGLKEIKIVAVLLWILMKLTNEPKVREFTSPNYEFLLFGKMEKGLLQLLQEPEKEDQRFQLLRLVQLIGKEELPEYQILQNYFAETPSLTFNTLLSSFKDIVVRDKVNALMNATKGFSPARILSKEHLMKILDFIMPVNIAGLQFLVQQYLNGQNLSQKVDDDVILFKGVTGSGKSTMILYLLGYKMIKQKDSKGVTQTVSEGQVHEKHRQIVSKSSNHSTTSTCHLAQLLNSTHSRPVYFMDSPGSEDTRGINRVILNNLIMKKTYQLYPKLKFVEVINTHQLNQQRINTLKKFTQYIVDSYNFGSIHDLRDILTVIFNKCNCNYDNIKEVLKAIFQGQQNENEFNSKQKIVLRFLLDAWNQDGEYKDCPVAIPIDFYCKQHKRELLLQHLVEEKACSDPRKVAKNILKAEYMENIHATLQYLVSSVRQWLNERRYDMVYHYYKQFWFLASHFENQQPSIGILCLQVPALIKDHFQRKLDAFRNQLRLNCSIVYNDDAMQTIKDHYYSIKQANIMRDQLWFNYTSFIEKLNDKKQQLLSSYQTALRQGSVHPQIVQNYKKFAQIFQQQVNLLLPLLANKTQLEEDIVQIIQSQSNYNTIDELYRRLKQVRERILNLNPNQPLQNRVETTFIELITLKYGALRQKFEQQIEIMSRQRLFQTQPTGPTELLSAIQEYQSLNHSQVLQELKADKNQTVLLQQLAQRLIVIIQQFRDEESLSREIVDNFKTFVSYYSQFPALEQAMFPHLADLSQIFTTKRNSIIQEYSKIMQRCKEVLIDPNEDIDANAINMSGGMRLCEIYSYYLGEGFNKDILQLNLIQFVQQLESQYSSRNIVIFKIKQEILKFHVLVKRKQKIKVIQSCLPHFQPLLEKYHQACRSFVLKFVKCIQRAILENTRLNKFVTQIQQKQLFSYFQTIQKVWPAIQRLGHSQICSELIAKAYSEVFDNCKILTDSLVTYNIIPRMYEHDAERQVYIKDLIRLFKFLFQLPENQYFTNRYRQINLKEAIIKKLMTQLKQIGSEILQNDRKATRQFNESVKFKLFHFQMLENMPLKDGAIDEQIKQVIKKLQYVNKQADKRNPITHDQPAFQVIYNLGLGYHCEKFKQFYDSGLHKRQARKLAFITFEEYLRRFNEKMDENRLNNTQEYDTLKDIKKLLESKGKKISALNEILIKIEDNFVAVLTDSYQKAENMRKAGDNRKSIIELTKIQQIRVKCLQKERQIRQKIKDLKKNITSQLNDTKNLQENLQRNVSINIYENHDKIVRLLQISHEVSLQQRIENILFYQIDKLNKISINSPDFKNFNEKSTKISSIVSMLQGHKKQQLTSQLDTIKEKLNKALAAAIANTPSITNNYGELMQLMYKQSILGNNKLVDQQKILFIKIKNELDSDNSKIQEKFEVLKRRFWVKDIASNVLDAYKTINKQWEQTYMDIIRMGSIEKEVKSIQNAFSNPNAKVTLRQENVEKYKSVIYFRKLEKHNHLFYNQELYKNDQQEYCERYQKIHNEMQANSQERNANNNIASRNCRIIRKIIEAISVPASEQPCPPDHHKKAAPQ